MQFILDHMQIHKKECCTNCKSIPLGLQERLESSPVTPGAGGATAMVVVAVVFVVVVVVLRGAGAGVGVAVAVAVHPTYAH